MKKNKTVILEMKSSISQITWVESLDNWLNQPEESISEVEGKVDEFIILKP
jgi:hypothetical protein